MAAGGGAAPAEAADMGLVGTTVLQSIGGPDGQKSLTAEQRDAWNGHLLRGKTKKNRVSDEDLFSVLTSSELHHSDAQMADPAWQVRDRSRSF